MLAGRLRIAHCGGLHVQTLNRLFRTLNALAKVSTTRMACGCTCERLARYFGIIMRCVLRSNMAEGHACSFGHSVSCTYYVM